MDILERLRNNKGTVSGKLSKSLAEDILTGNVDILQQAVELTKFSATRQQEKNIRAGAATIVDCVAKEQPTLIVPYLEQLFPALEVEEPQTRWMIIRTLGVCAKYNQEVAKKAIPYARTYLREKREGLLCLASAADGFLADYGAISPDNAHEIFPILAESAAEVITNEHDWLLEAFMKTMKHLNQQEKAMVVTFAQDYKNHPRKKTQARVKQLEQMCQ